ncbi:PilN domain-containing protein [Candidatus Synechococcus spongiarum]|uniref:PilN domain-containing protein n=1 Tax=Candidatus Synechococcus spongiarum TaxID=431041 RepID=UPI0004715266|nr:PilN domain-containing protein [Candidatus Synechococcus spongiarum]
MLLRGAAAGLALIVMAAALGAAAMRERQVWNHRVAALAPEAREHDHLQEQLQQSHHHLARLRQSNGALVQALTAHRPHSLLLMELAERTPDGVQLLELNGAPDGITMKGQAENWPLVNLFQLQLQASPLFQQGAGVQVKGLRQPGATGTPNRVNFQLTARFQPQSLTQLRLHLQQREAPGLVRRLHLLEVHGLLPPVQSHPTTHDQLQ